MSRSVTDQDICARCANVSLLKPPVGLFWEVPAICTAGWPRKIFATANAFGECARFEPLPSTPKQNWISNDRYE